MKKYFLTGLVTLLPLTVTIMAIIYVVHFLTHPFLGFMSHFMRLLPIESEKLIRILSQLIILITLFFITFGIGFVAHRFFFKSLLKLGDRIVCKIPLINKVYKTAKEIFQTLFSKDKKTFQQVVMVPFFNKGTYILGLISRTAPRTCNNSSNEELISIFIPATPNPMTGFLIMRPKTEIIYLDMRSEDAIKYIVSCGVVPPEPAKDLEL